MPIIHIDLETRSEAELKTVGVYAYAEHPSTSVLCAYMEHESGWRVLWTPIAYPGWQPPEGVEHRWGLEWLAQLFADPTNIFLAHNAEFDATMCEVHLRMPAREWIDTMALADYLSLPGGLDDLAQHLWGIGKDKRGYALMLKLCKPDNRRGGIFHEITHQHLTDLAIYNVRDVELMRRFFEQWQTEFPDCEVPVFTLHQRVNKRGLCVDTEVVRGLLELTQHIAGGAGLAVAEATKGLTVGGKSCQLTGMDLTRVEHLQAWFNTVGQAHSPLFGSIDACDEETLMAILHGGPELVPEVMRRVAEARLSISLASVKKATAALNRTSRDGRLRGMYRYGGAHTLRWTAGGVQPHNLPRPSPWLEEESLNKVDRPQAALVSRLLDACRKHDYGAFLETVQTVDAYAKSKTEGKGGVSINDCLTSIIRPIFIPANGHKLIGADFAQIEGRGAAWMAGDRKALDAYAAYDAGTGPHVYCVMASNIFGKTITKKNKIEYQIGKIGELASTFGLGGAKLETQYGETLAKAGVTGKQVVYAWRDLHNVTVDYWSKLEAAMQQATITKREQRWVDAGPVAFKRLDERTVGMRFPTGRMMRYHGARYEVQKDSLYGDRKQLVYDNHRKGEAKTKYLWGGSILENADQSLCRDLLAEKMVRLDAAGLPVVMHTHDEVVMEVADSDVAEASAYIANEMATAPDWAPGFPIKGDPAVMIRYNKDA